jgi:Sporulation and spore germination
MRGLRPLLATVLILGAVAAVLFVAARRAPRFSPTTTAHLTTSTPIPGQVVLFFVGEDGLLRREQREVPDLPDDTPARVRVVMDELIAGSRKGLLSPFPWAASVLAVFVDRRGNAYVDFSPPPSDAVVGTRTEATLIYSTVQSIISNCPKIARVQLLFAGRQVSTLGHLDLSHPLAPRPELVAP